MFMKKIFVYLLALLPMVVNAYDEKVGGIYYNFSEDGATVTFGDEFYVGDVLIPQTVADSLGTSYDVIAIGQKAFYNCSGVTSIVIPECVTSIQSLAFCGCSSLTEVSIPSGVTSIGTYAFSNCSGLTSVTIPNSVKELGANVFTNCSNLATLNIDTEEVGTFSGLKSLQTLILGSNVKSIADNAFKGCTGLTTVTIPSAVTSIGESTFEGCTGLTEVNFSSNITTIGKSAFKGCTGLTELIIPSSVTSIGTYAFSNCSGLTSVKIPNSVKELGASAFYLCSNLAALDIDTDEVGNAFSGLKPLQTLTLGSNVKSIADKAFSGCTSLTTVTIPEAVTSISESTFEGCIGLTEVNFSSNTTTIGKKAFYGCTGLTSLPFPKSLTSIQDFAFYGCTGLTEVVLPEALTSIGAYAFFGCNNLTSVKAEMPTPIAIDASVFSNCANATLSVPSESKAAYEAASNWSSFKNVRATRAADSISTDNVLSIQDKEVTGKQMVLPIALNNASAITGLQMDLYLPTGMTISKDATDKLMVAVAEGRMDKNDYTLTIQQMKGDFVRIAGYSSNNVSFAGSNGDILNVTLDIAGLAEGEYTVQIKDIVLSDINNTAYYPADIDANISVKVYAPGDVDGNGEININDVVCIVNHAILNLETGTYIAEVADINGDGTVDITDITLLVDKILGKTSEEKSEGDEAPESLSSRMKAEVSEIEDYLYLDKVDFVNGETMEVSVRLNNIHDVRGVQGNVKLPEGFTIVTKANGRPDVKNSSERSDDFSLSCALQPDGSMTFAQFSLSGDSYAGNDGGIFTFKVTSDTDIASGSYDVILANVVLSINGKSNSQPDFYGAIIATGIEGVMAVDAAAGRAYYDLQGRKLSTPAKGINIVRNSDGTTSKFMQR